MRVRRGRGRRNVRESRTCRHVGVENKLLDGHNLLAVAVFLQLAEQRLDLLKKSVLLSTLKLTKDFFYRKKLVNLSFRPKISQLTDHVVPILITHKT